MRENYFKKYLNKFSIRSPYFTEEVSQSLGLIVVIPCFNEPDVGSSLESIRECDEPNCSIEVIVVVNNSQESSGREKQANLSTVNEINRWIEEKQPWFNLLVIEELELPPKIAGVGTARKLGMDEAVRRFNTINKDGVIACFDADSKVKPNYFRVLEDEFSKGIRGANIYFEHILENCNPLNRNAIVNYELFLRYYNLALNYADFPHSYFTVGSSMAVLASTYIKVGGMNKRKAGEDFYFLQRVIHLGDFKEIVSTSVYPSSRESDRVPFGTGKAISDQLKSKSHDYFTYDFQIFELLKVFSNCLRRSFDEEVYRQIPMQIKSIISQNEFEEGVLKIKKNSKKKAQYYSSIFQLWSAFKVMKLIHQLRDSEFPDDEISIGSAKLLTVLAVDFERDKEKLLAKYREIDCQISYRSEHLF